ncbi:glyoxylase I family protein [Marmoricola sp. URHA0025 HA25]
MIGIHHVGIVVSDLDRSIDFYTSVLGLRMATEPSERASGEVIDTLLRLPGASLRGVMLSAGDQEIELLEFSSPPRDSDDLIASHALGAQHVAFEVSDVQATRVAITARGGQFLGPVNVIDEGPFAGLRTTFLLDPDDVRVELVEVAYRDSEARERAIAEYRSSREQAPTA